MCKPELTWQWWECLGKYVGEYVNTHSWPGYNLGIDKPANDGYRKITIVFFLNWAGDPPNNVWIHWAYGYQKGCIGWSPTLGTPQEFQVCGNVLNKKRKTYKRRRSSPFSVIFFVLNPPAFGHVWSVSCLFAAPGSRLCAWLASGTDGPEPAWGSECPKSSWSNSEIPKSCYV